MAREQIYGKPKRNVKVCTNSRLSDLFYRQKCSLSGKENIFANYPYTIFVSSKIMEMDSAQQNKVALYLFNSINHKIKYVNVNETLK